MHRLSWSALLTCLLVVLIRMVDADQTCTADSDCASTGVGSVPTCYNGGCYYETCYSAFGYTPSSDCFTEKTGPKAARTRCKCQNVLTGSNYRRRRDLNVCPRGHERCHVFHGWGGTECVDVMNDIESCGGCVGLDEGGPGVDCTLVEGADSVRCIGGVCFIEECAKGWVLDRTRSLCTLAEGIRVQVG